MNQATVDQPMPTGEGIDVIEQVIEDMELRAKKGVETYGTRLKTNNGRNALVDAYQEALDLAIYLKQRLLEEE